MPEPGESAGQERGGGGVSIKSFLAKWVPIVTPQWLPAFNAHWCFAYFVIFTVAEKAPRALWPAVAAGVVAAAVKEYYIDKHFETTHQTFGMNTTDFLGYMFGLVLALLLK